MFCCCPLHGKEISKIIFRRGERKKCFQCLYKTRDWIVKQNRELSFKILGCDAASWPSSGSIQITSVQQSCYGVGNTPKRSLAAKRATLFNLEGEGCPVHTI